MIKLSLISKTTTVVIPINPEELKISRKSDNKSASIIGMGEVVIPGKMGLMSFSIDGFAWDSATINYGGEIWFNDELNPTQFTNAIHRLQSEQKPGAPLRFVAEGLGMDMYVLIQSFDTAVRAGEEKDRYYSISFTEYRPYRAQLVEVKLVAAEKSPQEVQIAARNITIEDLSIGQIVDFIGGYHYISSTATSPPNKTQRTAGKATITAMAKGKAHPLHLIGVTGGSNVYGWVDLNTVSGITTASTNIATTVATVQRVDTKPKTPNPYTSVKGDTMFSVVRKFAPVNQDSLASIEQLMGINPNVMRSIDWNIHNTLPEGTSVRIPEEWLT